MGATPGSSAGLLATNVKLVETFSEHQNVSGVTVPTLWTLHYTVDGNKESGLEVHI